MHSGDGKEGEQEGVSMEHDSRKGRRALDYLARLFDRARGAVRVTWFEGVVSE